MRSRIIGHVLPFPRLAPPWPSRVEALEPAAALVLTGPGKYGFDAGRGWSRRPFVGSGVALVLGIGVGIGVWVLLNGANPLA